MWHYVTDQAIKNEAAVNDALPTKLKLLFKLHQYDNFYCRKLLKYIIHILSNFIIIFHFRWFEINSFNEQLVSNVVGKKVVCV